MKLLLQSWSWCVLLAVFLRELTLSVWDVALTVLHPSRAARSAIIAVPLDVRSEVGVVLFANMITLTPGTVSLHVSDDHSVLYVHVMRFSPDTAQKLKSGLERRIMEVLP